MKIIEKINNSKRPDSIHSIHAYEQDAIVFVDIVAHGTHSQGDEIQRFWDVSGILLHIKQMAGVAGIRQDGIIDHEEGRGYAFQVETI
jgi:hypothetical protein